MNEFKQWFQSLSNGFKIFVIVAILIEIFVAIGFAVLGFLWDEPCVVFPIVIIIVSLFLEIRRLMEIE